MSKYTNEIHQNEKTPDVGGTSGAKDHLSGTDGGVNHQEYCSTNGGGKQGPNTPEQQAIEFLELLRPRGPWVLTAIVPDGHTTTITARTTAEVATFVTKYNGNQNIYYTVNPCRGPVNKKPAKTDIAAIEYILSDLDPKDREPSEEAKKRYLQALGSFEFKPTALVDSGNGLQTLLKLNERISLGKPVAVTSQDGKTKMIVPKTMTRSRKSRPALRLLWSGLAAQPGPRI
jgi:hypothetical protein